MAFFEIEPYGPKRDNYHSAQIAHILANAYRERRSPAVPLDRFMWQDPVEVRRTKDERTLKSFRARVEDAEPS